MKQAIGSVNGIGAPLCANRVGGDTWPRYIGDRLVIDMHEGAGTTLRDLSGNGNLGNFAVAPGVPTWERNRLSFDGINDYVDCGNIGGLLRFSVVLEFRQLSVGNQKWIGICEAATLGKPCWIGSGNFVDLTKWDFGFNAVGTNEIEVTGLHKHTYVTTYDGSNGRAYKDGVYKTIRNTVFSLTNAKVHLAKRAWAATGHSHGLISFIRINASTFSANQVLAEYLYNKWRN